MPRVLPLLKDLYRLLRGERKQGKLSQAPSERKKERKTKSAAQVSVPVTQVSAPSIQIAGTAIQMQGRAVQTAEKETDRRMQQMEGKVRREENRIDRDHIAQVLQRAKGRQLLPR